MTDEITIGVSVRTEKSLSNTSMANSTPAIGAPKIALIPAAAPQPSRIGMLRRENPRALPHKAPIEAPITAIGASGPADPPLPMVKLLATSVSTLSDPFNFPDSRDKECNTPAKP
jgi:hypothetical protein